MTESTDYFAPEGLRTSQGLIPVAGLRRPPGPR
jgi:hypothetical protein